MELKGGFSNQVKAVVLATYKLLYTDNNLFSLLFYCSIVLVGAIVLLGFSLSFMVVSSAEISWIICWLLFGLIGCLMNHLETLLG